MKWQIDYSKQAMKFVRKHELLSIIRKEIRNFLLRISGQAIAVDVKRLKGKWEGFLRIRKGEIRIIFSMDKSEKSIYIERIDLRGNVYK